MDLDNLMAESAARLLREFCGKKTNCITCPFYGRFGCVFTRTNGYDSVYPPCDWQFPFDKDEVEDESI